MNIGASAFTTSTRAFTTTTLNAKSQSVPFLEQPAKLDGSMAGDVGFDPAGFLNWSMNLFERDKSVGTTLPWKDSWQWGLNCGELGRNNKDQNVSFWDHISTIFSRKSIEETAATIIFMYNQWKSS